MIQPFSTIVVEALPMNMPAGIYVDVSHLDDFEKSVRVGELEVEEGARILRDADEMVARVLQPRIEEEEAVEEVEEGEEGVRGVPVGLEGFANGVEVVVLVLEGVDELVDDRRLAASGIEAAEVVEQVEGLEVGLVEAGDAEIEEA